MLFFATFAWFFRPVVPFGNLLFIHALTNATRRHEYFRGLSRLLPVPGVLKSFLELHFGGEMALLALRGRPQPLKKPSQSQKGHFPSKMNALNDTKTPVLSKSAKETGNICDQGQQNLHPLHYYNSVFSMHCF